MVGKPLREGFHTVTPYLVSHDTTKLSEFLKKAFEAQETERVKTGGGGWHIEVKIGDSMVMMGQVPADRPAPTAQIFLYVEDADGLYRSALNAGATSYSEPSDQGYGRQAGVTDPSGNVWWLCRHKG